MVKKVTRAKKIKSTEFDENEIRSRNVDYHSSTNVHKMPTPHYQRDVVFDTVTDNQSLYLNSIKSNTVTFGTGAAGTGKSYVALMYAAQQLKNRKVNKVIITRPAVECGEKFGFLPGELEDKYDEYLTPMKSILYKALGHSHTELLFKNKIIEARPLAFMRGSTFEDSIVILDEAQNVTPQQMKMFLTRIGENSKVIINGDVAQSDIRGDSGLNDAVKRLRAVRSIGVVEFTIEDIVRSGIVKDILIAYQ
jgi:phosphate starvation-inducible PhoH-like protein